MIDIETPEGQLFQRLARELHDRRTGRQGARKWSRSMLGASRIRPSLQTLDDYRQGDPPLRSDIHAGWKPEIRQFMRMGRLNMADLIVTSTSNRLKLRDFRTSAVDDELGDLEARKIMRANGLGVVARDVHDLVFTMGDAYALVTPPTSKRAHSLVTCEDPRQVIVGYDPATRDPVGGLKLFRNDWDDEDLAYLFLPDGKVRIGRKKGRTTITSGPHRLNPKGWVWDDRKDQAVPGGAFPLVGFRNRDGIGEYERHLDTLDRINDKIFDEWWIAKIQAFRQRAVKNLPEMKEELDDQGVVRDVPVAEDEYDGMFTASPDEMWQVPGDVEFWESQAIDLTPITNAVEKDRARLASSTQTMLHTITPDAANGSAEGAALLREEFTFKCEDRRDRVTPSWANVMSLCFLFQGDNARSDVTQIEPQWAPLTRHSLGEKGSAAAQAAGTLPVEVIRRDIWQYEPSEVQEMRVMDGRDLLTRRQVSSDRTATV